MPKIRYKSVAFHAATRRTIETANNIIGEYEGHGLVLTLRQLFYQFVSRGLIANTLRSYKNLGNVISNARLAGLVDWNGIADRTRALRSGSHWRNPAHIIGDCATDFAIDKWATQPCRVEVWIEKDALVGVIERECERLDVGLYSCRGYGSNSGLWIAAQRLAGYEREGQETVVLYLGDHDPSGVDMTRDIRERLATFRAATIVERLALTRRQVDDYALPPNVTKATDSRSGRYERLHGPGSWELDALEPTVLAALVEQSVERYRDDDLWEKAVMAENEHRATLRTIADRARRESDTPD